MNTEQLVPFYISMKEGVRASSKCRSELYKALGERKFKAVKDGRRLLIEFLSFKQYMTSLAETPATIKPPAPRRPFPSTPIPKASAKSRASRQSGSGKIAPPK